MAEVVVDEATEVVNNVLKWFDGVESEEEIKKRYWDVMKPDGPPPEFECERVESPAHDEDCELPQSEVQAPAEQLDDLHFEYMVMEENESDETGGLAEAQAAADALLREANVDDGVNGDEGQTATGNTEKLIAMANSIKSSIDNNKKVVANRKRSQSRSVEDHTYAKKKQGNDVKLTWTKKVAKTSGEGSYEQPMKVEVGSGRATATKQQQNAAPPSLVNQELPEWAVEEFKRRVAQIDVNVIYACVVTFFVNETDFMIIRLGEDSNAHKDEMSLLLNAGLCGRWIGEPTKPPEAGTIVLADPDKDRNWRRAMAIDDHRLFLPDTFEVVPYRKAKRMPEYEKNMTWRAVPCSLIGGDPNNGNRLLANNQIVYLQFGNWVGLRRRVNLVRLEAVED